MKRFIGWLLVIDGAFLILIDLALTEGGPAGVFAVAGIVGILVGCAVLGCFRGMVAQQPAELSRLDSLHGIPLAQLTDEELAELRQEQVEAAYAAFHQLDYVQYEAVLAEMDQTRDEQIRRQSDERAQAGWVWPKEEEVA